MATLLQQPNPPLTAAERAARSVFVGNIPYEATEEQLKEIFAQAGPVVSFRLVYDRETGKPKGYGFCEYQDIETAQSAMRNLNNYDFNGRPLRVGVAAGEQNKEELKSMQQAIGGPPVESPYGDQVEPEKAPEAISKAVASLPPEQMFELMKQMKLCIQNNPNEARNMLLQNPQLAYALLQAQIVMQIVEPQVATAMLHRDSTQIPPLLPSVNNQNEGGLTNTITSMSLAASTINIPGGPLSGSTAPVASLNNLIPNSQSAISGPNSSGNSGIPQRMMNPNMLNTERPSAPSLDNIVPRAPLDVDLRVRPTEMGGHAPPPPPHFQEMCPPTMPAPRMELRDPRIMEPRIPPIRDFQGLTQSVRAHQFPFNFPILQIPGLAAAAAAATGGAVNHMPPGISPQDEEKAALIMQVLQLTDIQIAMLPPEQRQSILILKDQIAKSAQT
ncbi:cleavage stimulation factor subunit 2-like [Argonauta hians]